MFESVVQVLWLSNVVTGRFNGLVNQTGGNDVTINVAGTTYKNLPAANVYVVHTFAVMLNIIR